MTSIIIAIAGMPPPVLRGNSRGHWAEKHKAFTSYHSSAFSRLRQLQWEPMEQVNIQYTVHYCGKPIDADNFLMGMKAAQDAIVSAGIIKDDSPQYINSISVEYVRVKHRDETKVVMAIRRA